MAKAVKIIGLCFFLFAAGTQQARSQEPISCEGIEPIISFFPIVVSRTFDDIRNGADLERFSSPDGRQYWLCFLSEPGEEPLRIPGPLTLDNQTSRPIVIHGLNIRADDELEGTLLTVTGNQPVILQNSHLEGCGDCLHVNAPSFRMEHETGIECSGREADTVGAVFEGNGYTMTDSGISNCKVGLKLLGNGHSILSSTISNCELAIQAGDETRSADRNQIGPRNEADMGAMKFQSTENEHTLKVVRGRGNFFRNSWIFEESSWENPLSAALDDNILLEALGNGGMPRPIVYAINGVPIEESHTHWAIRYPPHAYHEDYRMGRLLGSFHVRFPYRNAQLEMFDSSMETPWRGRFRTTSRGQFFSGRPRLVSEKKEGRNDYLLTYKFEVENVYRCKEAGVLFQHLAFGSSPFSYGFEVNYPFSSANYEYRCYSLPGISSSVASLEPEIVSTPNQGAPMGIVEDYVEIISKEEEEKKKEEMAPDAALGTGEQKGIGGGAAGGEASGGFGLKCSLDTRQERSGLSFVFLFLALGILFAARGFVHKNRFLFPLLFLITAACQGSNKPASQQTTVETPEEIRLNPQVSGSQVSGTETTTNVTYRYHFHKDEDGDGFGDPAKELVLEEDNPPEGYVRNSKDCNDANDKINPQSKIPENFNGKIDYDCDGVHYWLPAKIINEHYILPRGVPDSESYLWKTLRESQWNPAERSLTIVIFNGDTRESGVQWSYKYLFNERGDVSAFRFYWHDLNSEVFEAKFYEYDENGSLKIERHREGESGAVQTSKEYDYYPDGKLQTVRLHEGDTDGPLINSWEYFYDEGGRLTHYRTYWHRYDPPHIESREFIYNDEGKLQVEQKFYNLHLGEHRPGDGKRYEYDENGYLIRVNHFQGSPDFGSAHTDFTYDSQGRRSTASSTGGDATHPFVSEEAYTYDENDNLKTYRFLMFGGQTREYEEIFEYIPIHEPVGIDLEWLSPVKIKVR